MENKAHIRYIRYLLSKRTPSNSIRKELARLALSSPDKTALTTYFLNVFVPLLQQYDLLKYYEEYLERLTNGKWEQRVSPILIFEIEFENSDEDRKSFCAFLRELEIEEMWSREITRYYGGIQNIPQNEDGERIIKVNMARNVESVLTCAKRYMVDKLLLENVAVPRISKYMWDNHQIKLDESTLYTYSKYFFNFQRREIEDVIQQLEMEKKSIESDLDIIENNENYSLGDKLAISRQFQEKIEFLDNAIKELNARYSDISFQQGISDKLDVNNIVNDIIARGYERLKFLDRYRDRDVVKPITDVAKMVFTAIDKKAMLEETKVKIERTVMDRDKSAQEVLLEMYQESYDARMQEVKDKLGEPVNMELIEDTDSVEGLDEV